MTTSDPAPVVASRETRLVSWLTRHRESLALAGLLGLTAALYLVNPAVNGWANSYYSGAAQAGSMDWTAFLYGSSDPGNTITVDKPPAALWPIALSIRLFGLNAASILLPQAIMGVATVGVLYATVRRGFPMAVSLIAASIVAVMPVAALMFRYNNPDALLVLLLTLATYFVIRGIEVPKLRWMILAGASVGVGFLAKELQAFLILPALVVVYFLAAPVGVWRRAGHLLVALGALILSAGWWVALIQLVPASARPYVGGSQSNTFFEVVLGYNGIGRITGNGYGNGFSSASSAGADRLLSGYIASQIGWLLPAVIVLFVIALLLIGKVERQSIPRALVLLFGGSLIVTTLALSFMSGIFHGYYTLAMAPAIGALVAIGAALLWRERARWAARLTLTVVVVGTAGWAYAILGRFPFVPGLEWVVLGLGIVAGIAFAFPPRARLASSIALVTALASITVGPLSYSLQTTTVAHIGSGPIAGPASIGGRPTDGAVDSRATAALSANASSYRWVAAALGASRAAELQLATGYPVIPLGGYKRSDPAPTLQRFQELVQAKAIHYFVAADVGGTSQAARIAGWVKSNFALTKVGGLDVYDLTVLPSTSNANLQTLPLTPL